MTAAFTEGQGHCTPGLLELHQITTPVIQVARDLKTAKGMWMSTGAILMLHDADSETGRSFTWDSGKYAVDFINLNGVWKICTCMCATCGGPTSSTVRWPTPERWTRAPPRP